jgi:hypothetical protein
MSNPIQPHPQSTRPYVKDYGIPDTPEGLLPWSYAVARLSVAKNYWVCSVRPNGRPHAVPVWGVWMDDTWYFDGSPETRRMRNLRANPAANVHLEDGSQVISLEGNVSAMPIPPPRELVERIAADYRRKYGEMGYAPAADQWNAGGLYVFKPTLAFGWTKFPQDCTRWVFG